MNLEEFKAQRIEIAQSLSITDLLNNLRSAIVYAENKEAGSHHWEKAMIEARAIEDEIKSRCA